MASLERDIVESGLTEKGFVREDRDHRFYFLYVDGKYTGIYTKTSRGKGYKTLGNDLVSAMAKQVKLSKPQFVELVSCTLSREEYLNLLREQDAL